MGVADTSQANYPGDPNSPDGCGPYDCNPFVHSIGVKPDGSVTYMALEAGHMLVLDTSDIAGNKIPAGTVLSLNNKLITNPTNRPVWLQNPADPTAVLNVFPNGCGRGRLDWKDRKGLPQRPLSSPSTLKAIGSHNR